MPVELIWSSLVWALLRLFSASWSVAPSWARVAGAPPLVSRSSWACALVTLLFPALTAASAAAFAVPHAVLFTGVGGPISVGVDAQGELTPCSSAVWFDSDDASCERAWSSVAWACAIAAWVGLSF